MDIFWCNHSVFNNLIGLHDRHLRVLAHCFVEVVLCLAELAISESVCLCDFDERVVAIYGFLHDVGFTVELACLFGWCHLCNGTVGIVTYGEFTGLDW
jgi:hypothetical protein